eukprot:TRINITY_DN1784_c0_g1_i1.p2 TRINITY_DN1784_c0_g1~~TRINITY_DN1784_c0_g1_i1.p2  ORF type:complete len:515 (-),score=62.67 TRINITY_DN1784_c0_g1_i1:32-1576(-)
MSITSEELNYLVWRYLKESGFSHSSFTFASECGILSNNTAQQFQQVVPGALISFVQKGLQYAQIETHVKEDGTEVKCTSPFTLTIPHICSIEPAVKGRKKKKKSKNSSNVVRMETDDYNDKSGNAESQHSRGHKQNGFKTSRDESPPRDWWDNKEIVIPEAKVTKLEGHQSEVFICAWSPTNSLLASGSGDSTARIWKIPQGPCGECGPPVESPLVLKHFNKDQESSKDVTTLDWNRDGTKLATGSYDGLARIWSERGDLLNTLNKHRGPIFSLKWNDAGDSLLSGSVDKTAIIWDAASGKVKQQFEFHSAPTLDVDWKDNTCFATCSTDKMIYVCELGRPTPLQLFKGHKDEVNAIKWDPTGKLLASCSDDYTAKIWSLGNSKCIHNFEEHEKEIYTIKWSPTGAGSVTQRQILASASFDATVKLWDVENGICMYSLTKHSDPVYSVAFSPNGQFLASGSFDRCLHIWSVKDGKLVKTFKGSGGIFEVCWNTEGDKVAACFSNNTVCVVDIRM